MGSTPSSNLPESYTGQSQRRKLPASKKVENGLRMSRQRLRSKRPVAVFDHGQCGFVENLCRLHGSDTKENTDNHGMVEYPITYNGSEYSLVDCSGMDMHTGRFWVPHMEYVSGAIVVAPLKWLIEYDDEFHECKLHEALQNFTTIANSHYFQGVPVILMFSKPANSAEILTRGNVEKAFESFDGEDSIEFIKEAAFITLYGRSSWRHYAVFTESDGDSIGLAFKQSDDFFSTHVLESAGLD
jgi:hypothetical protein